ncbi:MAG: hypothetical protein IPK99_01265 [Flavobacteriales bacterium]|nr:hypothetical protein [Flavobacteriales bacterium]
MRATLLSFTLLTVGMATAQTDRFPPLTGETSDGRSVTLPAAGAKGYTLVGLAFSQKASPLLEEWAEPAFLRFVAKHGLFADTYEADVWFIPMFVGGNKVAYEPSLKKFRKSADPEVAEHVLFFQGELAPFQLALGMENENIPYFFVLDAEGRIVHRTEGTYSLEKLDAIEERLME